MSTDYSQIENGRLDCGDQPCNRFSPKFSVIDPPGYILTCCSEVDENNKRCNLPRLECKNCGKPHHYMGRETCGKEHLITRMWEEEGVEMDKITKFYTEQRKNIKSDYTKKYLEMAKNV